MQAEESENQDDVYEKLKASRFKQQKLPAWRPVPTITSITITFISFGIAFIAIGIVVLIFSNKVVEISKNYTNDCPVYKENCVLKIEVTKTMKQPVMFYYQLDNFYQNHRRYVKSKSDSQLNGKYQSLSSIKSSGDCNPVETNKEMGKENSVLGVPLNQEDVAIPCGLIAKSFFNDTYFLYDGNNNSIEIDEKNIAWAADKDLKFKNIEKTNDGKSWKEVQWIDMEDEHFIVWMRPAGLPNFRKLYGRIREDIKPGTYEIKVNSSYDVTSFGGKKYVVLSTVNAFGGKNTFLGISYCVVGGVCILLAVIFLIGYQIHQKKEK